jgi:hypothetical protein
MQLNEAVFRELRAWGRGLPGFTERLARDMLALSQLITAALEEEEVISAARPRGEREHDLLLFTLDVACIVWLDDRFDAAAGVEGTTLDPGSLLEDRLAASPEALAFSVLRARFAREAPDEASYRLWLDTFLETVAAYHEVALIQNGKQPWSYAEHLHNGEVSVTVPHLFATLSLIHGLDLPARRHRPPVPRLLRHLCRTMRLQNDQASADKEREEEVRANAVLLMEEIMPRVRARSFVRAEEEGYRRLLGRDLDELGQADPLGRTARALLAGTQRWYAVARERYRHTSAEYLPALPWPGPVVLFEEPA